MKPAPGTGGAGPRAIKLAAAPRCCPALPSLYYWEGNFGTGIRSADAVQSDRRRQQALLDTLKQHHPPDA
ncbi:hypothetical protein M8494_36625 [Serratia ureilytica]